MRMKMKMRSSSAVHPRDFSIILLTSLSLLLIFFPPVSALARPLLLPSVNVHELLGWRIYFLMKWGRPRLSLPISHARSGSLSLGDSRASATPRSPPPPPSGSLPISPVRSVSPSLCDSHASATPRSPPPPPSVSPSITPVRSSLLSLGDSHPSATKQPPTPSLTVSPPSHQAVKPIREIVMVSDPYRPARSPPPPPKVYPPTHPISSDIIQQQPPSGYSYY